MADLSNQLAEAEAAYHALMTGQSVAELRDQNGELIRYTPANASRLLAYIQSLKQQRPELEQSQRQGRALLWDKRIDLQQQADLRAGRVPQTAYVYYAYAPKPGAHPDALDAE